MERKQVVVAAAVAVAALSGVTGVSDVLASSNDLPGPGVIRITATTIYDSWADSGHKGRGVGDIEVIRQRLFNRRITSRPIGRAEMVCIATGGSSASCSGTYFLPRGKVVVSGTRQFREIFELAVIGGTGIYDNVRGTVTLTSLGGKPPRQLLYFRLLV